MERTIYIQDGYSFFDQKDAQLAAIDSKKAEYIESRIDFSNPASVLTIYNKAIKDRIFKSPVGMEYLRRLQCYLLEQPSIEQKDIMPIPVYVPLEADVRKNITDTQRANVDKRNDDKKYALRASVIINITLVIAMIAMFVISLKSDIPNIINYENAIQNRYARWEQELIDREKVVREKERELFINEE